MTRPRVAIVSGIAVAVAYVVLANVSGHLDPFARRPILDGLGPPPPYRWVDPPAGLSAGNEEPVGVRFRLGVRNGANAVAQISSGDQQAGILAFPGAIPAPGDVQFIQIRIEPLAPAPDASLPPRTQLIGNVYRFTAELEPAGTPVTRLDKTVQIGLVYPALAGVPQHHVLLSSADGRRFTASSAVDSAVQLHITARVDRLGFFAVGATSSGGSPGGTDGGPGISIGLALLIGITAGLLVLLLILWIRSRRREAEREAQQRTPAARRAVRTKRRPSPPGKRRG